jgi:hypothetical protein
VVVGWGAKQAGGDARGARRNGFLIAAVSDCSNEACSEVWGIRPGLCSLPDRGLFTSGACSFALALSSAMNLCNVCRSMGPTEVSNKFCNRLMLLCVA